MDENDLPSYPPALDQRGRHNTENAYRRLEAAVKGE